MADPQLVELVRDIGRELRPYLPYGVGFVILWLMTKLVGEPVLQLIAKVAKEFIELLGAKSTPKSVNALVMILAFALSVLLFVSEPLRHILLPEIREQDHYFKLAQEGLYFALIFMFAAFGIICVRVTR